MPVQSAPPPDNPPARTSVARYPNLEAPDSVMANKEFSLLVSLTMEPLSTGVQIVAGPGSSVDTEGRLSMSLPPRSQGWKIGVVVTAPDFDIAGAKNQDVIDLPASGDSTPALFQLKPKPARSARVQGKISVTFWHEGEYFARATRVIGVLPDDRPATASTVARATAAPQAFTTAASLSVSEEAPDLTLYVQESRAGGRTGCQLTVESPYLQPATAACMPGDEIRPWLAQQYDGLLRAAAGIRGVRTAASAPPQSKEQLVALMRGLGQELYRRVGGPLFDDAFWKLIDREQTTPGFHFRSIQIYTNNPVIPWELMIPTHGARSRNGCLGAEFEVARWHINDDVSTHDKPPALVHLRRLAAVAPSYSGGQALPHQAEEIAALEQVQGFSRVNAQMASVTELLRNPPEGIVHFAGHGIAAGAGAANSAIELEGASLDSMQWRGFARPGSNHPFYFFNACDVGQTQRVLNFVDGWAPVVLDGGASGFLGGLWPLSDQGAADFAIRFYGALRDDMARNRSARIADLLERARRQFYESGDPTYLGYVFYGDVGLRMTLQ